MKSARWLLQTAIYTHLTNDTRVMDKVNAVYDSPDDGSSFPYVTIGDDIATDYSTKDSGGEDIAHTVHIWSRYPGKKEVKEISDIILQVLTENTITLSGFNFAVKGRLDYADDFEDPDGVTMHGVLRLRFKILNV